MGRMPFRCIAISTNIPYKSLDLLSFNGISISLISSNTYFLFHTRNEQWHTDRTQRTMCELWHEGKATIVSKQKEVEEREKKQQQQNEEKASENYRLILFASLFFSKSEDPLLPLRKPSKFEWIIILSLLRIHLKFLSLYVCVCVHIVRCD